MNNEEYEQLEKVGYISKKNRKGYYNSRYFQTKNEKICYWIDRASFEKKELPSTFEIRDIKTIEKSSTGRSLCLIFGDKFRIDLKCDVDECISWYEVLTAKKSFYSIKELLADLKDEKTNFKTMTFSALMVIPIKEQNDWILGQLDDIFEAAADDAQTTMLRSDPMWVLRAARAVVEEFASTCEECSMEMDSRNPKLSAHCRAYMHRYAELIKGRLALELTFFMATGNKQITEMGERALCAAISLMNRMDSLRMYAFLPHDLVNSLNSCLFTVGELLSALLNLSIQRIEAWFSSVLALPPITRGARLIEINHVLLDALRMIDFHVHDEYELYKDLLIKVAMSLQLNFSDQLVLIDLTEYDEASLLNHIKACHTIVEQVPSHFDISRRDEERDATSQKSQKFQITGLMKESDADSSCIPSPFIELSPAVVDSVRSACYLSAKYAVVQTVQRIGYSVQSLIDLLFQEGPGNSWIGGEVCRSYLSCLEAWLSDLLECIPSQYIPLSKVETARLISRLYLKALIKFYQENKRSKFSDRGRKQVLDDMSRINGRLLDLFKASDAIEEQHLFEVLSDFITAPFGDVLHLYASALQIFGIQYALQIYDLLRLCLKIRGDCNSKTRKSTLALCAEFYIQLQNAVAADPTLLGGIQQRRSAYSSVFNELCPKIGSEHCTGKKWSIERMTNPIAVRTLIARFVTETCQAARKSEKGRQKEIEDITRKEMEIAVSSLAISAVCPPLPPPPPPPPPPLPPKPIKYSEREQSLCASNGINGSKGPLKPIRQSSTSSTACSIASKSKEGERRREEDPEQSKNPFLDSDDAEEEHRRKGTVEVVRGNSSDKDVRSKNEKGEKKMQRCSAGNPFGDDESY